MTKNPLQQLVTFFRNIKRYQKQGTELNRLDQKLAILKASTENLKSDVQEMIIALREGVEVYEEALKKETNPAKREEADRHLKSLRLSLQELKLLGNQFGIKKM